MHFRSFLATCLLATLPVAHAQNVVSFNANYPDIPGDPEPRTVLWNDPRNWGGNIPGPLDQVVLTQFSYLESAFTVGAVTLHTTSIYATDGHVGSLEVLGDFIADTSDGPIADTSDGPIALFNHLTLRGTSTLGGNVPANTSLYTYRNIDNYGDFTVASTHYSPLGLVGNYGTNPTFTNHDGATFSFSTGNINGAYARFINATGGTITKTGATDATITFANEDGLPGFDNHGHLAVEGGQLTVGGASDWDGGSVALSNNAHLFFNFALPTGEIDFSGTGRISTLGDGNNGDTTLIFAPDSAITIDSFGLYNIHNLTIDGPVTLRNLYLPGDGLVTFRGAPTIDLATPNALGNYASYLNSNARNEGTLRIVGTTSSEASSYLTALQLFTNASGATLALSGAPHLLGTTTLENQLGARITAGPGRSEITWTLNNAGTVAVEEGTLQLSGHGTWTADSAIVLTKGAKVLFTGNNTAPQGRTTVSGGPLSGGGTIEFSSGVVLHDDFSLSGVANTGDLQVTFGGSAGYYPTIAAGTTLTLSGALRLGQTIISGLPPSVEETRPVLHLRDGVTLGRTNGDAGYDLVDVDLLTTGVVTVDSVFNATIDFWHNGSKWTNTGTFIKAGAANSTFSVHAPVFINHGLIDVQTGRFRTTSNFFDVHYLDVWTGSVRVASGATFESLLVLPQGATFSGQGTVEVTRYSETSSPSQAGGLYHFDDYVLPFAAGSHLTLKNASWWGYGAFIVNTETDFLNTSFDFDDGLILNGDTFWGPRTGAVNASGTNRISGHVANHADATLRGALGSLNLDLGVDDTPVTWDNLAGATFTLTGAALSPGSLFNLARPAQPEEPVLGTFNNHAAAVFIAGFGGGVVDWTFNNQGTVRIINGETLTLTSGGDWNGGRVELFQSYLNFRNTLPSGDFSVVGAGDLGFGAETLGSSGDYEREAIIVPEAGTTIRNVANSSGTTLDLGLYGDLTGPGRLTLYGERLGLEPVYNAPRGGFRPRDNTHTLGIVTWANEGGVELRGNLGLLDQRLFVSSAAGLDIYGRMTLNDASLLGAQLGASEPLGAGYIRVQAGGWLELTGGSKVSSFYFGGYGPTHIVNARGGTIAVSGSYQPGQFEYPLVGLFDNHGTLRLNDADFALFSSRPETPDWTHGRVEFAGTGNNRLTFGSAPPLTATFAGNGTVEFGIDGSSLNVPMDGRSYTFEAIDHNAPLIRFSRANFAEAGASLRLNGRASISSLYFRTLVGDSPANTHVELAGDFSLMTSFSETSFRINSVNVQNFGDVTVVSGSPGTPLALVAGSTGITWENLAGSTLLLSGGTDLLTAPGLATNAHFINGQGAQVIFTNLGPPNGDNYEGSRIAWDFTNRGEILVHNGAQVRFEGNFANEAAGTLRLESGGTVDFGANPVNLTPSITSAGGTLQATQFVVSGPLALETTGTLRLQSESLFLQDGASLNVGAGTLQLVTTLGGSGTITAGRVDFTLTTTSTTVDTLVFNAPVRVVGGANVDFGAGAVITLHEGIGGTGTFSADRFVVTGAITPGSSPGTLALVGDTVFDVDSVFTFELGRPAQDLITVDGNLTLDGTINFVALPTFLAGSYTLFTFTGDLTDHGLILGDIPVGFDATLFTDLSLDLVGVTFTAVSAIPEPSTYALIFGALALAGVLVRRRFVT